MTRLTAYSSTVYSTSVVGAVGLPTYLIVGAMTAGTTSLATWLRMHPQVFMHPDKELHFFDVKFPRGLGWYRSQFAGSKGARAVGEATPGYMYRPEVIDRMADSVPDAKLVAVLRDPVDRVWSKYVHHRHRGREKRPFDEAMELELSTDDIKAVHDWLPGYIARGRYLDQLKCILTRFPGDQLLVLLTDDMRDSPHETFATICEFIGVDADKAPAAVGQVYRPPAVLPESVRDTETFTPERRARLAALYADDNAALAKWLGRDLSAWTTPD